MAQLFMQNVHAFSSKETNTDSGCDSTCRCGDFLYSETKGKNVKDGETLYDEGGRVVEDPSAVQDLPEWHNNQGDTLQVVAKRVNIGKGRMAESGDPFHESNVIRFAKSHGLPTAEIVASAPSFQLTVSFVA